MLWPGHFAWMKHLTWWVSHAGGMGCHMGTDGTQMVNWEGGVCVSHAVPGRKTSCRQPSIPSAPCLSQELEELTRGWHWSCGGMLAPVLTPWSPGCPPQALLFFTQVAAPQCASKHRVCSVMSELVQSWRNCTFVTPFEYHLGIPWVVLSDHTEDPTAALLQRWVPSSLLAPTRLVAGAWGRDPGACWVH